MLNLNVKKNSPTKYSPFAEIHPQNTSEDQKNNEKKIKSILNLSDYKIQGTWYVHQNYHFPEEPLLLKVENKTTQIDSPILKKNKECSCNII